MKRTAIRVFAFLTAVFLFVNPVSAENVLKDILISHNRLLFVFSKKIVLSNIRFFALRGRKSTRYVFDFKVRSSEPLQQRRDLDTTAKYAPSALPSTVGIRPEW
jgi:hypothetical protein